MAQKYTQKRKGADGWEELYPKTSSDQVVTSESKQFVSAAEKASYAGKQDALGFTPEDASKKNQPGGYAGLDESGKLPAAAIPAVLEHDKGYFATPEALRAAHESASAGDFATIGTTDTVWIWDADGSPACWIDSMEAASGKAKITVGPDAPESPTEGDLWFDTSGN